MKIDAKNAQQYVRHCERLLELVSGGLFSGEELYTKLRALEKRAHNTATQYCNGEITTPQYEVKQISIMRALDRLGLAGKYFINGDPRGYALKTSGKLAEEYGLYSDWGGYGILAPDFS